MFKSKSFIFILVLLVACTNPGLKRRKLDQYFISSGVTRYFLPDLPNWANFSQSASCHRKKGIRYFDMKKLRESFSLNYAQTMHFQIMFNMESEAKLKQSNIDALPLKEEEKIFYTVSDKVQSGAYSVRLPTFKRVHLIWLDPFLTSDRPMSQLRKLLSSEDMGRGHPVFITLCLGNDELDSFMSENGFKYQNIRKITYEFFSLYDESKNLKAYFQLNFSKVFKADQKLHLYSTEKNIPIEFKGDYSVKYF